MADIGWHHAAHLTHAQWIWPMQHASQINLVYAAGSTVKHAHADHFSATTASAQLYTGPFAAMQCRQPFNSGCILVCDSLDTMRRALCNDYGFIAAAECLHPCVCASTDW